MPPVGLPETGELSYNGYKFDGATQIEVQTDYVYNDSGDQIKYHRYTISVLAVIANDSPTRGTNLDLENIRRKLGEEGRALKFTGKGFGNDLIVNAGGRVIDVDHGPKPRVMSWDPIGDNKAVEIVWRVEVTVPFCRGRDERFNGITTIEWGITYGISRTGATTRTLTGYLEVVVPVARNVTADAFRKNFAPPPVEGFRREQTWQVSPDRKRLNFTITDTEIETQNPFPALMSQVQVTQRTSWSPVEDAGKGRVNITATLVPDIGESGIEAWKVFQTIFALRADIARRRGLSPFLVSVDIQEGMFSNPQSMSVSYWFMSTISDLVKDSGLWTPLGTRWDRWRVSLEGSAFNDRGAAGMFDRPGDNVVVNLCGPANVTIAPNNNTRPTSVQPGQQPAFTNKDPQETKSWLMYESNIEFLRDRPVSRQSIIQPPDEDVIQWDIQNGEAPGQPPDYGEDTSITADAIQEGGASEYSLRLMGQGMRAGFQIPRPACESVNGVPTTETRGKFVQKTVGNFFGVPVYRAAWVIDYVLPRSPKRVRALPNLQDKTGIA